MSSSGDDTVGCIIGVVAVAVGGWWLWDKYEIREREEVNPPPIEITQLSSRPLGPYAITETQTGTVYHLDPSTVAGPREARVAWISSDHSKDKTMAARTGKELIQVDCETGATKTLSHIRYDANGEVITSFNTEPSDAETSYYPPGTVGAAAPREMCDPKYDN